MDEKKFLQYILNLPDGQIEYLDNPSKFIVDNNLTKEYYLQKLGESSIKYCEKLIEIVNNKLFAANHIAMKQNDFPDSREPLRQPYFFAAYNIAQTMKLMKRIKDCCENGDTIKFVNDVYQKFDNDVVALIKEANLILKYSDKEIGRFGCNKKHNDFNKTDIFGVVIKPFIIKNLTDGERRALVNFFQGEGTDPDIEVVGFIPYDDLKTTKTFKDIAYECGLTNVSEKYEELSNADCEKKFWKINRDFTDMKQCGKERVSGFGAVAGDYCETLIRLCDEKVLGDKTTIAIEYLVSKVLNKNEVILSCLCPNIEGRDKSKTSRKYLFADKAFVAYEQRMKYVLNGCLPETSNRIETTPWVADDNFPSSVFVLKFPHCTHRIANDGSITGYKPSGEIEEDNNEGLRDDLWRPGN